MGLGVLPGTGDGGGLRLRLAVDSPLLRVRAREGGRARHHGELFGIAYRKVDGAPVWHAEVDAYDVFDRSTGGDASTLLGRIYLDMHPREGKYKHYAQFTLVNGALGRALPEGVLMCNFPRPTGGEPALMEHGSVRTFFHEFGHLLHHVLGGHTRWVGQSGVATEWDFVEAPSQMLEEWIWDLETLQTFARHWRATSRCRRRAGRGARRRRIRQGAVGAPADVLRGDEPRVPRARSAHARHDEADGGAAGSLHAVQYVAGTYFHESFGHLDGYSAIYYTYMWSLVIAKDLFSVFRARGAVEPGAGAALSQGDPRGGRLEAGGGAGARLPRAALRLRRLPAWLDAG